MKRKHMPERARRKSMSISLDPRTVKLLIARADREHNTVSRIGEKLLLYGLWLYEQQAILPSYETLEEMKERGPIDP